MTVSLIVPGFIDRISHLFFFILSFPKSDDIAGIIDDAKRTTADAAKTNSDTLKRLNDIQAEISKINLPTGGSNLGGVLDDVDKTGNIIYTQFFFPVKVQKKIDNITCLFYIM